MTTYQLKQINVTVVTQYYGHVIHAGGNTTYRTVELQLTPEQTVALQLRDEEAYGTVIVETIDDYIPVDTL
jgi:hypothetical protein